MYVSELSLVVVPLVDLVCEPVPGLVLHLPDGPHAQVYPAVHRAEHQPTQTVTGTIKALGAVTSTVHCTVYGTKVKQNRFKRCAAVLKPRPTVYVNFFIRLAFLKNTARSRVIPT